MRYAIRVAKSIDHSQHSLDFLRRYAESLWPIENPVAAPMRNAFMHTVVRDSAAYLAARPTPKGSPLMAKQPTNLKDAVEVYRDLTSTIRGLIDNNIYPDMAQGLADALIEQGWVTGKPGASETEHPTFRHRTAGQ